MQKKTLLLTVLYISLSLFISCDFLENDLKLRSSSGGGKRVDSNVIWVTADAVEKPYNSDTPETDPPLTYKVSPETLPNGVSITGELVRDSGEYAGTYAIRQGTLKLTGENASKYTLKYIGNVFSIKKG